MDSDQITFDLYEKAQHKVQDSPKLAPHEDFIMSDWPEGDRHWQWVIDSPEDVILDWVDACDCR